MAAAASTPGRFSRAASSAASTARKAGGAISSNPGGYGALAGGIGSLMSGISSGVAAGRSSPQPLPNQVGNLMNLGIPAFSEDFDFSEEELGLIHAILAEQKRVEGIEARVTAESPLIQQIMQGVAGLAQPLQGSFVQGLRFA